MRLKLPRIEAKPKSVVQASTYRDYCKLSTKLELGDDLLELIECIKTGKPLSPYYYRSGIDEDVDHLLEESGIMHLHLGGQDSDVLVFLVQYPDRVVLLEINDHKHFRTDPVGSLLHSLHFSCLKQADEAVQIAIIAVQKAEAERQEERVSKIRASVDRLMRRKPKGD